MRIVFRNTYIGIHRGYGGAYGGECRRHRRRFARRAILPRTFMLARLRDVIPLELSFFERSEE
jgi:hypothetical protein